MPKKSHHLSGIGQDMNVQNYVGLCKTEFKTRWNIYEQSFKNRKLENAIEFLKYI